MTDTKNVTVETVARNPETGAYDTHLLTPEQENARAWFGEHLLWAFGRPGAEASFGGHYPSAVADAVRGDLRTSGMPEHMIEKTLEDVVWAAIRGEWTAIVEP